MILLVWVLYYFSYVILSDHQDAVLFHLLIHIVPTTEVKKPQKRKRKDNNENQVPEDNAESINEKKTLKEKRESYMLVIPVNILYLFILILIFDNFSWD